MKYSTLAFVFLLPLSLAQSPWLIGELSAEVTFSGDIDLEYGEDSRANWVEAAFYSVPEKSPFQDRSLISSKPPDYEFTTDDFGNEKIVFKWQEPSKARLQYTTVWDVSVDRLKYAMPALDSAELPEDITPFKEPDNLTVWSGYMKAKAEALTKDENTTLGKAKAIVGWINSEISYDKSCWKDSFDAQWVFLEQRGVCDEFTNLFISMARSIGIPARYVEGLVYSGEDWNFHAWAEIYTDAWLAVDPTYAEIGLLDSSHILLAKVHGDGDVFNVLRWEGSDFEGRFLGYTADVRIKEIREKSLLDMSLDMPSEVSGSEDFNVSVHISSLADSPLVASCSINMPGEMLLLDRQDKFAIISGRGDRTLSWKIASPATLDKNWLHSMPIQVSCFPGKNLSGVVKVDPREQKRAFASAKVWDLTVLEEDKAYVKLKNDGTKDISELLVRLCVNEDKESCKNKTVASLTAGRSSGVFFEDVFISEGTSVYASIHSKEIEESKLETRIERLEEGKVLIKEKEKKEDKGNLEVIEAAEKKRDFLFIFMVVTALLVVSLLLSFVKRKS